MIRHTLLLLFTLTVLSSCEKDQSPEIPPQTVDQTVLLYMPGLSLTEFYQKNIEGITAAVDAGTAPGSGRMVICYQPENYSSVTMLEIYCDTIKDRSASRVLKKYKNFDTTSRSDLAQLFADVARIAPAHRYGLMVGCHGKAWIPASTGSMGNFDVRPSNDAYPSYTQLWTPAADAKPTRSFGDKFYELDIATFTEAVKAQNYRFDYLIFDACFMASIETLYDMRDAFDYVVAAPCEIMAAGFPYERALPWLFTDGGASHDLQKVCEEFYKFYNEDWDTVPKNERSGCISLAVTSQLDALAEVMRRINAGGLQPYTNELQSYEGMRTHVFYDLGHYVASACSNEQLAAEFSARLDEAFPETCRLHTPSFYSGYGNYGDEKIHPVTYYSGVSTSEPSTRYQTEFQQTTWYQATH